jgi:hypothetical protein
MWRKYQMPKLILKGGPGSGHHGHAGRPGHRGGSASGSVAASLRTGRAAAERRGYKPEPPKPKHKAPPTDSVIKSEVAMYGDKRAEGRVRGYCKVLPQRHLDTVAAIYASDPQGRNVAGTCDQRGTIRLMQERNFNYWDKGTVIHEVGHAVLFETGKYNNLRSNVGTLYRELLTNAGFSGSRDATRYYQESRIKSGVRAKKGFPSTYSMTSRDELFAESYSMYVRKPAALQKRSPEMYELLRDQVFDGVEYVK